MDIDIALTPDAIQEHIHTEMYAESFTVHSGAAFWLERSGGARQLAMLARPKNPLVKQFAGERETFRNDLILKRCQTNHANAAALRLSLPWLQPRPIGTTTSFGFGDRLGNATPGHTQAMQRVHNASERCRIVPFFAQQSIREMSRTNRTPDTVMSDATWGAFRAGWRGNVGADADHLKTPADIDRCADAGFTFFTIDPSDYVEGAADTASHSRIQEKVDAQPWKTLDSSPADMEARYVGRTVRLQSATGDEEWTVHLRKEAIWRAAAKYGSAIAHVVTMARHLKSKGITHEIEVSVDETEIPTSHAEHIYIVEELQRLGVRWISLAPRYVGRFEKGIDYIGHLETFRSHVAGHAAIAQHFGPYKLGLHSGSDKFSIYPIVNEVTQGVVHIKTAGTSYLEALHVVAHVKPELFRRIADFARRRYPHERATYHVSAELERVPQPEQLQGDQLHTLLDNPDARQVLHVTYGSILEQFGEELLAVLEEHEREYDEGLAGHFVRHLTPLC